MRNPQVKFEMRAGMKEGKCIAKDCQYTTIENMRNFYEKRICLLIMSIPLWKPGDSFTASAASPRPLISGLPKFAKFTLTLPKLNSSVKLARQMAFCYTARYRPRKEPLLFSIVFSCPAAGGVKTIAARKADQRMLQGLGINIQGCDWNGKVDYALVTVVVMTSIGNLNIIISYSDICDSEDGE